MTRFLIILALATAVVAPRLAFAQPTPADLEAAKKAFVDGKALHDQGKLADAVDKFKESYRLSKNPLLLYNIGYTYDELKKSQQALVWYRKFLNEAPKDAAQRQEVTDRVKVIEKELEDAELNGGGTTQPDTTTTTQPTTTTTQPPPTTDAHGKAIKPPGTYKAEDFQHQIVTEAPPGKPLDLSAFVPEDSGFTVTMFFRGAGESAFTAKPMHWRYKELVARIPAAKMSGSTIQYYLEVKDATGAVVTRSGKSTSPNVVDVDASAPPRFYPDLVDNDTGAKPPAGDDNPLGNGNPTTTKPPDTDTTNTTVTATAGGFGDVGSKKFRYLKWGTTGAAGALLAGSLVFYIEAGKQADALKEDAGLDASTGKPCTAPCHPFDGYDADLQSSGQRDQTLSRVFLGVGIAGAAVAGYLWWKESKGSKHEAAQPAATPATNEMTWIVVPAAGDGFTGMAAAARF